MKYFSKNQLADVEIYLGEPNEQIREGMRFIMRDSGLRRTRSFSRISDMVTAIKKMPPDLLILSDDIDPTMFDVVRDIRHYKIGYNPFIMISLMVEADNHDAVRRAILTGADDVMIKPVSPGTLLDRVAHITKNRLPFVVTNDYLGPERRKAGASRPSKIKQLDVINTLKAKTDGNRMNAAEIKLAVKDNMKEVMSARLDSHGLKLGWICGLILKAYKEKRIDKELEERLLILIGVLEDAATTATDIGEPDIARISTQMAREVENMAEVYENPTDSQLGTIEKLTKAFELAKTARTDPSNEAAS